MKAVPNNNAVATDEVGSSLLASARLYEQQGDHQQAIKLYEAVLKKFPQQANIYDRLFVIYRKEKEYKKELSLLNAAIDAFTRLFNPAKNKHSKKIARLSKSILQTVGLTDKRGHALYLPQPIARWEKRKKTVQLKLAAGR